MVLSYAVYAACLALILWGARVAFAKGKYNDDFMSLDSTKALRGIAALGVLLHHISQQEPFQNAKVLSIFVNAGIYFVGIFFFCSGYGLIKSYKSKTNYLDGFIKKRIVKTLVIPFYVNALLYALMFFLTKADIAPQLYVTGILGLSIINEFAWFPIVLSLMYLVFYFSFKYIKSSVLRYLVLLFATAVFCAVFVVGGHFVWWRGPANWWLTGAGWQNAKWYTGFKLFWFSGEWWCNTIPVFIVGMLFADYEDKILGWLKKFYCIKLLACIAISYGLLMLSLLAMMKFGYWTEFNGKGPGIFNKFVTLVAQIPSIVFIVITIFMIMMKFRSENPVTKFLGNISLDTYLMNFMAMSLCSVVFEMNLPLNIKLAINTVAVIALSIILGLAFRFIYKKINQLV